MTGGDNAIAWAAGAITVVVTGAISNAPLINARAKPCCAANRPGTGAGIGVRRIADHSSTPKAIANCAHATQTTVAIAARITWLVTSPAIRSGSRSSGFPIVDASSHGIPTSSAEDATTDARTRGRRRRTGARRPTAGAGWGEVIVLLSWCHAGVLRCAWPGH